MMGYGMDMFFSPYSYMGQGNMGPFFGIGNGNGIGSFVTYQCMNEWFDMCKRMTGANPDFQYDKFTKHLVLIPEPKACGRQHRLQGGHDDRDPARGPHGRRDRRGGAVLLLRHE